LESHSQKYKIKNVKSKNGFRAANAKTIFYISCFVNGVEGTGPLAGFGAAPQGLKDAALAFVARAAGM
jgi:hypothetical protein